MIWPIAGPHAETGAVAERPISARCRRVRPPTLPKSPPTKRLPLGPSRITKTDRLAPGFHLATWPPVDTAARLLRARPPTAVNEPPR